MSEVVIVLSTVPDDASAESMARTLVGEHLAACVNVLAAMTSVYRWQGKIEQSVERQVIIKTSRSTLPALHSRLRQLHSYELPEFIVLDVESGGDEYLAWVARESSSAHQ